VQSRRSPYTQSSFRINQHIELVVFDPELGKLTLYSRIQALSEDAMVIHWPVDLHGTRYFFKQVNFAVLQCLAGGEILSFKVDIRSKDLEEIKDGLLELRTPKFVEQLDQKRVYIRVQCQVPVKYRYDSGSGFSDELFVGSSVDMSIGGMELASFEKLEPGTELECFFTLNYVDFRGVQAKVVRRSETQKNGNLEYLYALNFLGMLERERVTLNQILMKQHPMPAPRIIPKGSVGSS
jgi:c-di-GMP-binding flagellar brake protein YcgR